MIHHYGLAAYPNNGSLGAINQLFYVDTMYLDLSDVTPTIPGVSSSISGKNFVLQGESSSTNSYVLNMFLGIHLSHFWTLQTDPELCTAMHWWTYRLQLRSKLWFCVLFFTKLPSMQKYYKRHQIQLFTSAGAVCWSSNELHGMWLWICTGWILRHYNYNTGSHTK